MRYLLCIALFACACGDIDAKPELTLEQEEAQRRNDARLDGPGGDPHACNYDGEDALGVWVALDDGRVVFSYVCSEPSDWCAAKWCRRVDRQTYGTGAE